MATLALALLIGDAFAGPRAREDYQQGSGAYAGEREFSTRGTKPEIIVDLKSPRLVSLCNDSGAPVVVIYDGKRQVVDVDDCIDVEAAKVEVQSEKEGAHGRGNYYIGPAKDPDAKRSRTE